MKIDFVSKSNVELVKTNATDADVALAAWVSNFAKEDLPVKVPSDRDFELYNSYLSRNQEYAERTYPHVVEFNKRIKGLINFLYRERHMSPFEHGSFTFYVDTPIFVAREFMRHRTFSFNETSGRYKELDSRFYLIDSNRPIAQEGKIGAYRFGAGTDDQYGKTFAQTSDSYIKAQESYQLMLDAGVAREVARNVLPVGAMTQFYATANPRNVMQFLLLRNDDNALYEIREVAQQMEEIFAKQMPFTYEAFKKHDWRDLAVELEELRKVVAQYKAEETYRENIYA